MSARYPQYRVSQWLDTSDESMAKCKPTITYGVQTKRAKGGPWMNCLTSAGAMMFDHLDKAAAAIDALRAEDKRAARSET